MNKSAILYIAFHDALDAYTAAWTASSSTYDDIVGHVRAVYETAAAILGVNPELP